MNTYIIDASVAVKWVVDEIQNEQALYFLSDDIHRIVPDIIFHECLNAVNKIRNRGELEFKDCVDAVNTLFKEHSPLQLIPVDTIWHRSLELANNINHPIYDCLYLATAELHDAVLVTADRVFYDLVITSSYSNLISWIEKFPTTNKRC